VTLSKPSKQLADLVKNAKDNLPAASSLQDPDTVARAVELLKDRDGVRLPNHNWLQEMRFYVLRGGLPTLGQAIEVCRLLEDDRPSSLTDPATLGVRLPHQRRRRRRE
jgi:hypothetical protein